MATRWKYTDAQAEALVAYFNVTPEEIWYEGWFGTWVGVMFGRPAEGRFYTNNLCDLALEDIARQHEMGIATPEPEHVQVADTPWGPEWSASDYWTRVGRGIGKDIEPIRLFPYVLAFVGGVILVGVILWE